MSKNNIKTLLNICFRYHIKIDTKMASLMEDNVYFKNHITSCLVMQMHTLVDINSNHEFRYSLTVQDGEKRN